MCEPSFPTASPSTEKSGEIKAINKEAVHRICSGQVVLNLATAVKELVENSLDAGATVIEIRLKEYGSELVEVTDNGTGVQEQNLGGLTLKHHTSKLREFSDLAGVETFGFRGEALSSLCALSELTVITRHGSSATGTKLIYDSNGHILSKTKCARQVGTTVSLANLFSTLPVRQKEFLRNIKREFVKMSHLLYGYCLIASGVKISCVNHTKSGRTVVVTTQGSGSVKDNIACIFGAKQVTSLLDIRQETLSTEQMEELGLKTTSKTADLFQLDGCVSSCAHSQGRSSADRQFFYINSRPCEPTKVAKVVNEVYHQFNVHQFPFVFLNITTDRSGVDVNVTPDKRQIFLDNEKFLLATIKVTLLKLYETIPSTFLMQNVIPEAQRACTSIKRKEPTAISQSLPTANQATSSSSARPGALSALLKNFSRESPSSSTETRNTNNGRVPLDLPTRGTKRVIEIDTVHPGKRQTSLSSFIKRDSTSSSVSYENLSSSKSKVRSEIVLDVDFSTPVEERNDDAMSEEFPLSPTSEKSTNDVEILPPSENVKTEIAEPQSSPDIADSSESQPTKVILLEHCAVPDSSSSSFCYNEMYASCRTIAVTESSSCESGSEAIEEHRTNVEMLLLPNERIVCDEPNDNVGQGRREVILPVDLNEITRRLKRRGDRLKQAQGCKDKPIVKFYAEIDPNSNKSAEQELSKEISKDMFSKMTIIGQFNLGFIITQLGNDLFIVDQHATDEKYNFETLERTTVIQNQKLIIPQTLELTPVNEGILMDNLEIFRKNGFDFIFDENGPPTRRVQLSAIPVSRNWEFGREDVDELLFMLSDAPHTMCRPSRVRAMFASRACRKSVMIGKALSKSDMRRLINHMGEIEQPWNCPHGRPTMRHLVNLVMIRKE